MAIMGRSFHVKVVELQMYVKNFVSIFESHKQHLDIMQL